MAQLRSRAPQLALSEHPEFPLMLVATLERFHCTLGEVREDYWQNRLWRALAGDPDLEGRIARVGVSTVLLTGHDFGAVPVSARERARWRLHVMERIVVDTGRPLEAFGVFIKWAEGPVAVGIGHSHALIAQTVLAGGPWSNLERYGQDLSPVMVPVAYVGERILRT